MAKFVVTATAVTMGGEDISTACARAELVINAAEVETTDFGSGGFTEVIGGLKSGTLSLDFHQDFGTDAVSTLFLDTVGTVVIFTLIAGNGITMSETTPKYTVSCLITSFTPVSGAVGDLASFSVSFPTTGAITYATAA